MWINSDCEKLERLIDDTHITLEMFTQNSSHSHLNAASTENIQA